MYSVSVIALTYTRVFLLGTGAPVMLATVTLLLEGTGVLVTAMEDGDCSGES